MTLQIDLATFPNPSTTIQPPASGKVVLAGGCVWCTEAIYGRLKGVLSITPGYAGTAQEYDTCILSGCCIFTAKSR